MPGFIEEFYYGNLDTQGENRPQSRGTVKALQVLSDRESYLTNHLTGEQKRKFLDYVNAWGTLSGESALDNFTTGFRLGAMFILDTFSPFHDD